MAKSEFIKIIRERGYFNQCTDLEGLDELMSQSGITAYIGFDCTARSLHIGSLVQIMLFRILQQCGHRPVVLMGGGTTKIGDPTGKDEARKILPQEEIEENKHSIAQVFGKFINFGDGSNDAIMVDNAEWLESINYIEFLRDYGRHFSVNRMLTFDSVKLRLEREQPLSFLEFNYMILQAYDFVELNKRYGCRLQLGGSDQWGNIINGVDLGRRLKCPELFGITSNLITTSSGAKMGKTAKGAMWLNPDMLSPYDYWQFWRNTEDADVEKFLKMFTELPLSEIKKLAALQDKEINEAKIILANEATKLCHGEAAALSAYETAKKTFEQGAVGENLPICYVDLAEFNGGIQAFRLFNLSGLAATGAEAKRLIQGSGARINNELINDEHRLITDKFLVNGEMKLSAGKKKHAIIKVKQ
ncbi:tyrosine--tRNA ligase [Holosporaceae bacterium 'Namur']|nr:tyrosine--tRNA ligase [Holosporaceae bacterium 'Namur']